MDNKIQVVNWNISYMGNHESKLDFLFSVLRNNYCVLLQEVKPHVCEYIKSKFQDNTVIYSLDYRPPSKFDSDARKLGVMIILSKNISVKESGVIERNVFPDRTLYATVDIGGKELKLLALHSITGCSYYRAKSAQYDSFAEFIDTYSPDIIGIDANEPQIDSFDIEKMKFFDNGKGAQIFFHEVKSKDLCDSFVKHKKIAECEEGKPIAVSHNVKRKGVVRYDFLFSNNKFEISSCEYLYDEAINAGSDHAAIVAEFLIGFRPPIVHPRIANHRKSY